MAPLNLPIGPTSISVKVQPVVLFTVCDAYIRRPEGQERVIGTLLGTIDNGVVEIRNCYAVPHTETQSGEVADVKADVTHHKTLYDLHQKVNPKEVIVGWYSTGHGVSPSDAIFQGFYANECQNPVHLTVDTTLSNGQLAVTSYVARPLTLRDRQLALEFQEVPSEIRTVDVEKIGVEVLSAETTDKMPTDLEALDATFSRLRDSLDRAYQYVDDVVAGRRKGDVAIGRYLADTVAAVPRLASSDLEKLVDDTTQDMLLVMYLSNLVRTHLALADKLGTSALPLL